jgi:putative MATE family efflux protein
MNKRLDLTQGPISKLIVKLAVPSALGMMMHTAYNLADLFFVGRLGSHAVAAISIAGNAFFIMMGLSIILGTGAMAMIAQAFGRKDHEQADRIFKQSILLTVFCGLAIAIAGFVVARAFIDFFGGQGDSLQWGVEYFQIYSISMMVLLLLFVIGSCFRGMGDTKTPMFIMMQSTILNIILDPILIFGLLGLPAMGVQGAAIASLLAQLYALARYAYLLLFKESHVRLKGSWRPDFPIIKRSLAIGLPSGLTMYFLALNMMITYRVISSFGTAALASVGIGFRIIQACYLPVLAVTGAVAAAVGQNYGAKNYPRILGAYRFGFKVSSSIMILGTVVCWIFSSQLIGLFSHDSNVIFYGTIYLTIMSLSNIVVGSIMNISSVFQGLGKTYPTLVGAAVDNGLFALCVLTLPVYFGWGIHAIWWIKISTALCEVVVITYWLKVYMGQVRKQLSIEYI